MSSCHALGAWIGWRPGIAGVDLPAIENETGCEDLGQCCTVFAAGEQK